MGSQSLSKLKTRLWRLMLLAGLHHAFFRRSRQRQLVTSTSPFSHTSPRFFCPLRSCRSRCKHQGTSRHENRGGLWTWSVRTLASWSLLWKDAVLIGVADKRLRQNTHQPEVQHGLACDPSRVVTEHDRVFMVSEEDFPKRADSVHQPMLLPLVPQHNATPYGTLVCGWRRERSDIIRLG